MLATVGILGLIDSWPTDREVDAEMARILFPQLEDPGTVATSYGVELSDDNVDCSQAKAATMLDGAKGATAEALNLARKKLNKLGVPGSDSTETTAVGLYCIDGFAGSAMGRNKEGITAPDGFATVSNPEFGPLKDRNPHAETNILASITDSVRPTPGSSGFVIIMTDRDFCNLCRGYVYTWTQAFPGIAVYVIDPVKGVRIVAGEER